MYQKICIKTSEIILTVLSSHTEIKDNAVCNPIAYFNTIYRLQSGVLRIAVAHNLNRDLAQKQTLNKTFNYIDNESFTSSIVIHNFNTLTSSEKQALEAFYNWFKSQHFGRIELSDLYEMMLLLEFPVQDGAIAEDKENLNSIGSFYTPSTLADKLVAITIDQYIFQNLGLMRFSCSDNSAVELQQTKELISQSTFADYSCGTGSFFLAIIRYLEHHLHFSKKELKAIVLHFYAIEADALSLEIAKIQILEAVDGLDFYPELGKRFINGNPLIAPDTEAESFAYGHDFYYHNGLALHPKQIQHCDVIIGNPPWGTVGFDLNYYLHLLCPRLAEIDDEQELDAALETLEDTHPALYECLLIHDEAIDVAMENIYNDDRFNHSSMGGLQTNVLFTELCDSLCTERGTVGLVLKGSTLSDSINKRLVNYLSERKRIRARYDFKNANQLFNIDKHEEFSILILGDGSNGPTISKTELDHLDQIY